MAIQTESRPTAPDDAKNVSLNIGGMTCAACVSHVEKALREVDGVASSAVNLATERATVQYSANLADIEDLRVAVEDAGYSVLGVGGDEEISGNPRQIADLRTKAAFSIAVWVLIMALMAIPTVHEILPFRLDILLFVLASPVQFWAGKAVLRRGLGSAQARHEQHEHAHCRRDLGGVRVQRRRDRSS